MRPLMRLHAVFLSLNSCRKLCILPSLSEMGFLICRPFLYQILIWLGSIFVPDHFDHAISSGDRDIHRAS